MKQLVHNGVIVLEPPSPNGLVITARGEPVELTPKQEEMALAWAKKQGTPYVEDSVFVRNFLRDFSETLGVNPALSAEEVDFAPAVDVVLAERETKARLTKEERKAQAAARKAQREKLRELYVTQRWTVSVSSLLTIPWSPVESSWAGASTRFAADGRKVQSR